MLLLFMRHGRCFILEASHRKQGIQMPVAGLPCRTIALPRQLTERVAGLHGGFAVESSIGIEIQRQRNGEIYMTNR